MLKSKIKHLEESEIKKHFLQDVTVGEGMRQQLEHLKKYTYTTELIDEFFKTNLKQTND